MTQIDDIEQLLLVDKSFQHILKFAPESQRELMTFELAKYFTALIATQINQAKIEAQKEISAFATRVQANGQYIPIEVGLIPWLEAQLSNTHKEQL